MRQYLIGSWANADGYDYNGEMLMGSRNGASRRVHWNPDGSAAVQSYGDDQPKTKKPSLRSRILPQSARVDKLRSEAIELELAFKAGEFTPEEYTLLREVAFKKLRRAEELLKKAITPIQKEEETDEDYAQDGLEYTPSSGFRAQPNDGYASEGYDDCGVEFIDSLSSGNSFKKILQKGCKGVRTLVRWHQASKRYIQTLKEV